MAEATTHRVRTRSRSDAGFRRAGIFHTPEPAEHDVTAEQLEKLLKERDVVVEVLDGDAEEGGKTDRSRKKLADAE